MHQITNVVRARSAEGLSAFSFELESWGLLVHAAYGYINRLPFSSYGEAAILLVQNLLLLSLVYRYAKLPSARVIAVFSLIAGALGVLASGERLAAGGRRVVAAACWLALPAGAALQCFGLDRRASCLCDE